MNRLLALELLYLDHSHKKKTLVWKRTIALLNFRIELGKLGSRTYRVHKQTKMAASSTENVTETYDLNAVLDLLDAGFFDNDPETVKEINSLETEVVKYG